MLRSQGRSRLLALAPLLALVGCSDPSNLLVCELDGDCVRGGEQGQCFDPGHCAFDDDGCASGYRWDSTAADNLADECVADGGGDPDAGTTANACGGTTALAGQPGTECGPCASGLWQCSGSEVVRCDGEATLDVLITPEGAVSASTEFSGSFRAELAVDADLSTSWFSSGPEGGGQPTVYRWTGPAEDCITTIDLVGNGGHDDSDFRTGFGFGQVTIQIELRGTTVYSQVESMPGTPDPDIDHATGGVVGDAVVLLFTGHEAPDCGGIGELTVGAIR